MRLLKTYLLRQGRCCLHLFVLGMVLFLSSACVPMLGPDDEFEYNPSKKRELSELKKSYALFNRMDEIDVALYLSKRDFVSLVNDSFRDFSEHFTSLDAGEFSNVRFAPIKFHLSNQQLVSRIGFSLQVDGLQREIHGHVMGTHRLEAASNTFILKTDFDEIIVGSIDGTKVVDKNSENIKLIEKASKNFMRALNVESVNAPLRIPVDLNILSGIKGKDIFAASDYKLHSARRINMRTKMRMYLPYIGKHGIVFLGSGKIRPLAKSPIEERDIEKMSEDLSAKIDAALKKSMGISLAFLQEESSYYVSKAYLSGQMNVSLRDMDLRTINKFFLQLPQAEQNLSREIYFSGKEPLPSCEGVATDCAKRQLQCSLNCSKHYGSGRCAQCERINNPFEKVRCMSDYEACKSKEELHLYECLKEEERCAVANRALEDQCKAENLRLIAQCEAKKEKLPSMQEKMLLARLHLKFGIANSYAIQRIHKITFDADLSRLEVDRNIHLSVDSKIELGIAHADNKDIRCTLKRTAPLFVHSSADYLNLHRSLPLLTQSSAEGALMIRAKSRAKRMPIVLENSPYAMLLEPGHLAVNCTYQNMPIKGFSAEQILDKASLTDAPGAMLGEIDLKFEEEELTFSISPVKIGEGMYLYPSMHDRAVGFSRQAHFY